VARLAMIAKSLREPKYAVRKHHRCGICGRARAYMRKFGICRICFRKLALEGKIPGIVKASW